MFLEWREIYAFILQYYFYDLDIFVSRNILVSSDET